MLSDHDSREQTLLVVVAFISHTWGKELGKDTHQWMTNDEKYLQALSTFSVFVRLKKKDKQQKEQRSREEDRRVGGNQT